MLTETKTLEAARPGMDGALDLTFRRGADGVTHLTRESHRPPLRIIRPFAQPDGSTLVHLQNIGGGVLSDDRLRTRIDIGEGASVQITTTGATRVYRTRDGSLTASQDIEISVGPGGLVEYLPDPLIPYAGASYRQHTKIALSEGAGVFWWETVAPGRIALGELFAYDDLTLLADIDTGGRPIARERMKLTPSTAKPSSMARFGPYRYLSTFYVARAGEPQSTWSILESEIAEVVESLGIPGESTWSSSALARDGLVVRGLTHDSLSIASTLLTCWRIAKRRLYGSVPTLPRKIY